MTSKTLMGGTSPFKTLSGKPEKITFQDLMINSLPIESWGMACSDTALAFIHQSSGGVIGIVSLKDIGRSPPVLKLTGHRGFIGDLGFNPVDSALLGSTSDDSTVKLWRIPATSAEWPSTAQPPMQPVTTLTGHSKKVYVCRWNPVANGILASGATDPNVIIWNTETGSKVYEHPFTGAVLGLDWSIDGSTLAVVSKDKKLRFIDPRAKTLVGEIEAHEGVKSMKLTWIDGQRGSPSHVVTTGFTKMAKREVKLWDLRALREPKTVLDVDQGSGFICPHWEESLGLLFLVPKGDALIRPVIYEHQAFIKVTDFRDKTGQRATTFLPTRCVDTSRQEVVRVYKATQEGTSIVPVSFTVLRKDQASFHDDLYPPCINGTPALTAEKWVQGATAEPNRSQLTATGLKPVDFMPSKSPQSPPNKQEPREDHDNYTAADQRKMTAVTNKNKNPLKATKSEATPHEKGSDAASSNESPGTTIVVSRVTSERSAPGTSVGTDVTSKGETNTSATFNGEKKKLAQWPPVKGHQMVTEQEDTKKRLSVPLAVKTESKPARQSPSTSQKLTKEHRKTHSVVFTAQRSDSHDEGSKRLSSKRDSDTGVGSAKHVAFSPQQLDMTPAVFDFSLLEGYLKQANTLGTELAALRQTAERDLRELRTEAASLRAQVAQFKKKEAYAQNAPNSGAIPKPLH